MKLDDEIERLLLAVVDHFDKEDRAVRERQIRTWRRLKLFWDGFQRIWYSEVAHDWRIWDEQRQGDTDQSFYEKPVNIFRAYLESIIAALSVTIPPIKCFPDNAKNNLDLLTAKAGDKISELIYRHNDVALLWLHALYTYCTEGMVACYNYSKSDESYGTYEEKNYEDAEEMHEIGICPNCGAQISDVILTEQINDSERDEFQPEEHDTKIHAELLQGKELCPNCYAEIDPEFSQEPQIVTRLVGVTTKPKTRQCLEVYGGLYVKIPNYAKKQKDIPYLILSYETHFSQVRDRYPDIRDKVGPGSGGAWEPYERWGRLSPQYYGEYPVNNVTVRNCWLRPSAFEILPKEDCKKLRKKFPDGSKVVLINQEFAEAENESLDDHWTLTENPLTDYLYHDPLGLLLTSIQEITNDLVSLVLQTIEHGIPQTFADPSVLNFDAYRQTEVAPGMIFPAIPKPGKTLTEGFHEVKTATLSGEVLPFAQQIQTYGQLVSGALPSLFGGQMGQSKTASEYSMSRAQALQRLQSTWKLFTIWWKNIFGKVIPQYIKEVKEDEHYVEKDSFGNFIDIFIHKAELEGKIGNIELEANENLPITWNQKRDIILKLMEANNPQVLAMLASPENLPLIYEAIGISDFAVPGEDDRNKQYDEIKQLLDSEPISVPTDPNEAVMAAQQGLPCPPDTQEHPSVEVDQFLDNHQIEFQVCRAFLNSDEGRLAKTENPNGYHNVLLHAYAHFQAMQPQVTGAGAPPIGSTKENTEAPITGEQNVATQ